MKLKKNQNIFLVLKVISLCTNLHGWLNIKQYFENRTKMRNYNLYEIGMKCLPNTTLSNYKTYDDDDLYQCL